MNRSEVYKSLEIFNKNHQGNWISNPYHDTLKDVDIGHIIQERLTGVRGDKSTKPDYHGYELKVSTGQVSLCTSGCYVDPKSLLKFGKQRKDGKIEAYQKFYYDRDSDTKKYKWKTRLLLSENSVQLVYTHVDTGEVHCEKLPLDAIQEAYDAKLKNLILCNVQKDAENNRIKIKSFVVCEGFSFLGFCNAIKERKSWFETRCRTGKNRGNTFRMAAASLPLLYKSTQEIT